MFSSQLHMNESDLWWNFKGVEQAVFYSLASTVTQQTAQLSSREPENFYKELQLNYCSESPMIFCNLNQPDFWDIHWRFYDILENIKASELSCFPPWQAQFSSDQCWVFWYSGVMSLHWLCLKHEGVVVSTAKVYFAHKLYLNTPELDSALDTRTSICLNHQH